MNRSNWVVRNLANFITLIGCALIFVLQWVIFSHREWMGTILVLGSVILVTDLFDGPVARHISGISDFGAAMDRLRDKFFQLTMLSFFLMDERVEIRLKLPVSFLILIEVCLLGTLFMGIWKKKKVSAGGWGKAKMALMSTGILVLPASILARENGVIIPYSDFVTWLLTFLFIVSSGLAVMSFKRHMEDVRG